MLFFELVLTARWLSFQEFNFHFKSVYLLVSGQHKFAFIAVYRFHGKSSVGTGLGLGLFHISQEIFAYFRPSLFRQYELL